MRALACVSRAAALSLLLASCSVSGGRGGERYTDNCWLGTNTAGGVGWRSISIDSINGMRIGLPRMPCPVTSRSASPYFRIKGSMVLDGRRAGTGTYSATSYNYAPGFVNYAVYRRQNGAWLGGTSSIPVPEYALPNYGARSLFDLGYVSQVTFYAPIGDSLQANRQQTSDTARLYNTFPVVLDTASAYLVGPTVVDAGSIASWRMVPDWDTTGYQKRWTVAGSFTGNDSSSIFSSVVSGAGARTVAVTYRTTDAVARNVSVTVSPRLVASISGPTQITEDATYSWVAGATGASSGASYQWWLVKASTNESINLGTASAASAWIDGSFGDFTVSLLVTGTGYVPNSAITSVTVQNGCGGLACLRLPADSASPRPARGGARSARTRTLGASSRIDRPL